MASSLPNSGLSGPPKVPAFGSLSNLYRTPDEETETGQAPTSFSATYVNSKRLGYSRTGKNSGKNNAGSQNTNQNQNSGGKGSNDKGKNSPADQTSGETAGGGSSGGGPPGGGPPGPPGSGGNGGGNKEKNNKKKKDKEEKCNSERNSYAHSVQGSGMSAFGSSRSRTDRLQDLRERYNEAKEKNRIIVQKKTSEVVFPEGWAIPSAEEFQEAGYLKINFSRDIEKHLIKPFSGFVEDYFRFRETFFKCVHVQQVPIFYKLMALDNLLQNPRTQAMMADLGTSDQEYADRIQRLEHAFGDEDKYQSHLMTNLTELRRFSAHDETSVARFGNLLRTYLNLAGPLEAANVPLRQLLKTKFPREWTREYALFRARTNKQDDLITICEFASEAHEALQKTQDDLRFEKEMRATYQANTKKTGEPQQKKYVLYESNG